MAILIARYTIDNKWYIDVCESVLPRPYLMAIRKSSVRLPSITDYPIHYNRPATTCQSDIAYDNPEKIPERIKAKVRQVFELHPECKISIEPYMSQVGRQSTIEKQL